MKHAGFSLGKKYKCGHSLPAVIPKNVNTVSQAAYQIWYTVIYLGDKEYCFDCFVAKLNKYRDEKYKKEGIKPVKTEKESAKRLNKIGYKKN
jgi:hypothetical protein